MNHQFNLECLEEHNRLRALHGCPEVELDEDMAHKAQQHADYIAEREMLENTKYQEYGENLAQRFSTMKVPLNGAQATRLWYHEIKDYNFDKENQLQCGHFSQIVWASTTKVGFGIAYSADSHKVYIVGFYDPPGNYTNEWVENVPSPLSGVIYIPTHEEMDIVEDIGTDIDASKNSSLMEIASNDINSVKTGGPVLKGKEDGSGLTELEEKPITITNENSENLQMKEPYDKPIGRPEILMKALVSRENKEKLALGITQHHHKNLTDLDGVDVEVLWFDPVTRDVLEVKTPEIKKLISVEKLAENDLDFFREKVKDLHNQLRRAHGCEELKQSPVLDKLAQDWAAELARRGEPSYFTGKHEGMPLGQNVSVKNTIYGYLSAEDLVAKWLNEASDYDYNREPTDAENRTVGHFTQCIWKTTRSLGIGRAFSPDDDAHAYVVVFYHPPGNLHGMYQENILPPKQC